MNPLEHPLTSLLAVLAVLLVLTMLGYGLVRLLRLRRLRWGGIEMETQSENPGGETARSSTSSAGDSVRVNVVGNRFGGSVGDISGIKGGEGSPEPRRRQPSSDGQGQRRRGS